MKKIWFVALFGLITGITRAQDANTVPPTGKVSFGDSDPNTQAKMTVAQSYALGANPGDNSLITSMAASCGTSNVLKNNLWLLRASGGSSWTSTSLRDGISIDVSGTNPTINTWTWWDRNPLTNTQSWGAGGTTYMSLVNDHLGIGTANPQAPLEVRNNTNGWLMNLRTQATNPGEINGIKLYSGYIGEEKWAGLSSIAEDGTSNFTGLSFYTRQAEKMRLSANGDLGVGTSAPNARVDIFNNNPNSTNLILSANYVQAYRWRFNTIDRGAAIDMDITASDGNDSQETILKLSRSNTMRPSLVLMNNWLVADHGNIGIGTTDNANWHLASSTYKLAVGGNMIAENVTVKLQNTWADYVFDRNYPLLPLADLHAYVLKNHHLPEMPSATQIEKDGQNLGEINRVLVKKVEELTLYLAAQDKQIKDLYQQQKEAVQAQQTQLDELKKQVSQLLAAKKPIAQP